MCETACDRVAGRLRQPLGRLGFDLTALLKGSGASRPLEASQPIPPKRRQRRPDCHSNRIVAKRVAHYIGVRCCPQARFPPAESEPHNLPVAGSDPSMSNRVFLWLKTGVRLALLSAIAIVIACGVLRAFDFRQAPDYGEGTILAAIERMERESISTRWIEGPVYTLSPYGPVYYWTVQAASQILPWQHSLLPGRLISLLATLAIGGLIAFAVHRQTKSVELGMLSVLLLLLSPVVHTWATPHRVDPLAVLFALIAYMGIGLRRSGIVLSACAVVLASLVKQNMAFAAAAVFLYLLFEKRFKAAFVYAILVAGLGAGTWGALNQFTGGYFLATAVKSHLGAMWPQQGFVHLYWFLTTPVGLVASIVIAWLFVKRPSEALGSVYAIGFVMSVVLASLLSCKEGASYAYFFEASVLGTLVIGLYGLPAIWSLHEGRALAMAVLLALLFLAPEARWLRHRGLELYTTPYGSQRISSRLASAAPAYVLADGQYLDAVLHAGLTPLVNDPFLFRQLVGNGRLPATGVVQAIEQGQVPYLVLKRTIERHRKQLSSISQKWPGEVLDAMERHYVLDTAEGEDLFIYRWRDE